MKSLNNLNINAFESYERISLSGASNIGKLCLIKLEKTAIKAKYIDYAGFKIEKDFEGKQHAVTLSEIVFY